MRRALLSLLVFTLSAFVTAQTTTTTLKRNSNLRSGPYASSKNLGTLKAGTSVEIVSKYARLGYVRVHETTADDTGWVLQNNLASAPAPEETSALTPAPNAANHAAASGDGITPDLQMTPGKPDPSVTQANIAKNICSKQWSTDFVRPPASVTNKIKTQTMTAYGFTDAASHYELDHLISLQVGGCPDCVDNLWPQAYGDGSHPMTQKQRSAWNKAHPGSTQVKAGSLEKDIVENHVHDEICYGIPNARPSNYIKMYPPTVKVTLKRGQQILATDWYGCYKNIMNGNKPCE